MRIPSLKLSVSCVLAAVLSALSARANDIELGKENYSAFQKTIKADGDLSDWGDSSVFKTAKFNIPKGSATQGQLVSFEEYSGGTWTGPEDHTTAFAIAWDVDNLYVGLLVTDDYHENAANSAWNGDSLQIVFANASRDTTTQYYNYALGGEEGALGDLVKDDQQGPGGAEFVIVRSAAKKETYYEIRFPASSLEVATFAAGMKIGIGLCANDGDQDSPGQKGWSGWGTHAIVFGTSPAETGLVTLQTGAFPGSAPFPDVGLPVVCAFAGNARGFTMDICETGPTTITTNTVQVKVDGATVTGATAAKTNTTTTVKYTPPQDLPFGSHTVLVSATDSAGTTRTYERTFTAALPSNAFVIEAEDFDYEGGKTNPQKGTADLDVDVMPYLGGAYEGLGAVEGVDYNNDDANDGSVYREELDENGENEVSISTNNNAAPGSGKGGSIPINSSDRGSYTTTANYRIGWVNGSDWQNYTRTFPDHGGGNWWKVYAALSYDGGSDGQLAGSLDKVTSGVGTDTQITERAGEFSAPGSGGWGNNNLVPMKNASGGDALVKLVGKSTVRFNMSSGDFDFLAFIPASPPPPFVEGITQDSAKRSEVVLDWTLRDTDTKVNASTIKVFFDGNDVTSKATSTTTNTGATIHLDLIGTQFAAGEHPWRLTFSDTSNPAQNVTADGNYVVNPYPTEGVFVIEAEDFNYSDDGITGGKTNPQKGTAGKDVNVMPYDGGAYDGLSAVEGVDYNNNDGEDSLAYRTELDETGGNEVNITISNGNRYSNDRGVFELTSNYRIGWVEGGSWQDYTRTFPQGSFNVWAALSYDGRANGQLNGSLDLVTSDPTKTNQTTQSLGSFSAPGSGGWGRNELVPMKDSKGAVAAISLGGVQTVRFNLGSGDFDYLLFVPQAVVDGKPKFSKISISGGNLAIEWTGGGTLVASDTVTGTYTPVAGNPTSPANIPISGTTRFFGIR